MCVICRIKDFEYVIQPCGHLTCDVCSELDMCICNAHVTSRHVAYYHDNLLLDTNLFQKTILRNDYEKCLEALLLRC